MVHKHILPFVMFCIVTIIFLLRIDVRNITDFMSLCIFIYLLLPFQTQIYVFVNMLCSSELEDNNSICSPNVLVFKGFHFI